MATELEMQENLKKIEKFFGIDMRIKQELIDVAPSEIDGYNQESMMAYSDKLYEQFEEMEYQILQIINMYGFGEVVHGLIKEKLQDIKNSLINAGYTFANLKKVYRDFFSGMSKQLVDSVQDTCKGYYTTREFKLPKTISQCKTINEILHVLHSYVVNNEKILQGLPKIDEKTKSVTINTFDAYRQPKKEAWQFTCATLYGVKNEIAQQIYMNINPEQKEIGESTIIGLENKVLMMVRDRGHALTLEIDTEGDKSLVRYFIPKICNIELVNQLRGVTKVAESADVTDTATGCFECEKNNIGNEIVSFVEKVPTDSDILPRKSTDIHIPETTNEVDIQRTITDDLSNFAKRGNAQKRNKVIEIIKKLNLRKRDNENNKRNGR